VILRGTAYIINIYPGESGLGDYLTATGYQHRVLVVCNDADYFLRHRLAVVEHLVASGVEVVVVTGGHPIAEERIVGWTYVHIPIERFAFDPIKDAALWLKTFRLTLSFKPDAVHLVTMKPMVFSGLAAVAARRFGGRPKRVVATIPGLGRMMSRSERPTRHRFALARFITEHVVRFLGKRESVHFTFETIHDRDIWVTRGLIAETKTSVIDGAGVDPAQFFSAHGERKPGPFKVLFASRLLRAKGLDVFLEVARQLSARADVEFLVAGMVDRHDPDGIPPSHLENVSEIRFLGEIEDMPSLLRDCDIVCLPTKYGEGIPRILIEAAASGLPAIASDVQGCSETVIDGVTGRIIPVSDNGMATALASAVVSYLDQPQLIARHGDAAHALFLSRDFGEVAVVKKFADLLVG